MFCRSPSASESLKGFGILNLPSTRTLQDYKPTLVCNPGEIEKRLRKDRELYDCRVSEALHQQKSIPLSEGALIFDEVKVSLKLQWNSHDDKLVGYR